MKTSFPLSIFGAVSVTWAHYTFDQLIINGVATEPNEFVRENTREEKYMPTKFLESFGTTPLDDDFRCNQGSFTSANRTGTAEINAGDTLAMRLAYGATMQHPGPAQVYLSKAPGLVREYEGGGDWFKIHQETLCESLEDALYDEAWCTWDKDEISFRIPLDIPAGEYLVRAEHIGLHGGHVGHAEFYYACAQVRIASNGTGTPEPTVKIPGVYDDEDPAIRFNIYGAEGYPYIPGPPVWSGNAEQNTSAPVSSTVPASSSTAGNPPESTSTQESGAPCRARGFKKLGFGRH